MKVWKPGTTVTEAVKDNWARDINYYQTYWDIRENFGVSMPFDIIIELYRLYEYKMEQFYNKGEQN